MANPTALPLRLAFTAFALSSLTIYSSSSSLSPSSSLTRRRSISSSSASSTAVDLLSLLGSKESAAAVNARDANRLRSCLRFLVPFPAPSRRRRDILATDPTVDGGEADDLVWRPPSPVLELARIAVDSGGDPASIHRTLDVTVIPVPDVEGSKECKCELTRTPYGRRFVNKELNSYMAFLFEMIAERGPSVGLNVSLDRFDLFHGHIFLAPNTGRLGILFHAKEYPAYEKKVFPFNMGYCQTGSNLTYDDSMNLRNILWLAPLPSNVTKDWVAPGVLVVLDARPDGIIYKDLVPEYVDYVRTIYEDDFGEHVADVNYLNVGDDDPTNEIFIC
ncbi:hypothetical protein QJS04_geneDACA007282 [Acorus gramineus]|uniref:Uncharacterized protein n=1 Tax=Acorus gramineus TaxID=55184 RepID=A0AAV9BQT1_ACOGR|nr:hypothetical protein QJS04_geneDACA007282 [Acorus gramineus]